MEYWDIYDKDKKLTGRTMERNDWNMADGDYHLTVLGAVKRPDGRFLITQRKLNKQWAPGAWEVSGGGVSAGESSREAVFREVSEEVGLDLRQALSGGYVFTYRRDNPQEHNNYFVDVYCYEMNITEADVCLQASETEDFRFATVEEIKALADQGMFLHYDSIRQIFE